jgi:uncharacterized protein YecE (DUF72 family)
VGTSGYAYQEWIGPFYPPGTKSAGMLSYYAGEFESVELNYTFRRLPTASAVANWVAQTPDGFIFSCKANQGITHHARLVEAGERVGQFLEAVTPLGDRLGPVLFQCPPTLGYDPEVLDAFLKGLPAPGASGLRYRYAMEFRHPSFDTNEVRKRLAAAGVAWCVADTDPPGDTPVPPGPSGDTPVPPGRETAGLVRTADDFAYLRLRRGGYDAEAIAEWARAIGEALEEGVDVYAYLKHEDSATGPRDAAALRALAAPD